MTVPGTSAADRITHLRATLAHGKLAASQHKRGTALLERLTSPVRLTLLGLPGSGKSELVNLLVGQRVLPTGQGMPTSRLVWGAKWTCIATGSDGSTTEVPWPAPEGFDWSKFGFVQVSGPIELLKSVSILEVVSDGSAENLDASVRWAVANSDMAIWVTQSMERLELTLWRQVPDTLKDHSFVALTKADQLAVAGVLPERIATLSQIAEEEFYGLYPVATLQYLAALRPDGPVDKQVRSASGGGGLIDAVLGDVRRGREADLDGAEIFLARYGIDEIPDEPLADAAEPQPISAPAPAPAGQEAPATAEPAIPTPQPVPRRTSQPVQPAADIPTPRPVPRQTPEPASAIPTPKPAPRRTPEPAARAVPEPQAKPAAATVSKAPAAKAPTGPGIEAAYESLKALGQDLAGLADADDAGFADEILTLCMTRFEDMVADLPTSGGPLVDELEAASEAVILLQLDGGESSAADAVTVVLQLTRELEMAQAA